MMSVDVETVRAYWDESPCQFDLSLAEERRRYFDEISDKRFGGREWHVPLVAQFPAFRGKDVLEIGCGIATDGLEFARNGARYAGVDLTPHAIELARERFVIFGVPGQFAVANAEQRLPFPDASFDHVYSFGVIHHSPAPEKIVGEMYRVLREGGTFTVMLYNRTSINYYAEIMFLRKVFRWCLLPQFMPQLIARVTGFDRAKLEGHRSVLLRNRKMSHDEWVSINTDGPDCPLARVYDRGEAAALFGAFANVRQDVWEFNVDHWPFIRGVLPERLVKRLGGRWGWHRMIYGVKSGQR
jgi:ubiquinone/menaquinone biosynthesis C-methylase UbiE